MFGRSLFPVLLAASLLGGVPAEAAFVTTKAPADGVTPAWPVLQREIDGLSAKGGGTLVVPAGRYLSAQIELKRGVTLSLERNAVLVASTNHLDYLRPNNNPWRLSVVCAYDTESVGVTGKGRIEGNGTAHGRQIEGPNRWRLLHFVGCRKVRVEGVTLENSNYWTAFFDRCDGVTIRGVTVNSIENYNNDGLDVDSRNVLIEDCDLDCDDDAICFKSHHPDFAVERCEVRNCRISSHCNFIKFGTASEGVFRDIEVHDCKCYSRTGGIRDRSKEGVGTDDRDWGISAIALEVVDGGGMERVTVRDIELGNGVICPVFIRLGERRVRPELREPFLRDVLIENVRHVGYAFSVQPVFVSGVPGRLVRDVTLRNVDVQFKAQGRPEDANAKIIEEVDGYPEVLHFGPRWPCYGAFIRHAKGVRLENFSARTLGPDPRKRIVTDNAEVLIADDRSRIR